MLVAGACGHEPTAVQNAAPLVTVLFPRDSSCTPLPGKPCEIEVTVQASDPDGDQLRYVWSGCATGTSDRATCTIQSPGVAVATVSVSDDQGHSTTGSAAAAGANQPPSVEIRAVQLQKGPNLFLSGNVIDPDEGIVCGSQTCQSVVGSGSCGEHALFNCSCVGGVEVAVARVAETGVCTVTFAVKDSWGQVGMASVAFDVSKITYGGVLDPR